LIGAVSDGPTSCRRQVARTSPIAAVNLGVAPASLVDQQHSFVGDVVELADDLLNQDMDEALVHAASRK
jgi:hypothetical protein